jgi:hypothetical protein
LEHNYYPNINKIKKAFSGQRPKQHPNRNMAKWDKQNAGQMLAKDSQFTLQ